MSKVQTKKSAWETFPHDPIAEESLITTFTYHQALFALAGNLEPEHFHLRRCRDVFVKMKKVVEKNRQWEPLDFPEFITRTDLILSTGGVRENVKRLIERKMMRDVWIQTQKVVTLAHEGDVDEIWSEIAKFNSISRTYYSEDGSKPTTWKEQADLLPTIRWAWKGWLPAGFMTIVVGAPDIGKSAFMLALAKSITTGASFPDGTLPVQDEGKVVWVDTESSEALNHKRAREFGVDLEDIIVPTIHNEMFTDLNLDDERTWMAIDVAISQPEVKLVVIDSLGGSVMDENKPIAKITMKRLGMLARDFQIPVVVVHHPRKLNLGEHDEITLDRVRGHSGIIQFARSIIAIEKPDPHSETRRSKVIKLNLGIKPEPVGFSWINDTIVWDKPPIAPKQETVVDRAAEFLRAFLNDGRRRATDVYDEGTEAGHSKRSLQRAKEALGINPVKDEGVWWWSLPYIET